jgi:hypothetical protein
MVDVFNWHGDATHRRLEQWIANYNASFNDGCPNEFTAGFRGYDPVPIRAMIAHKHTGTIVAQWTSPNFTMEPIEPEV